MFDQEKVTFKYLKQSLLMFQSESCSSNYRVSKQGKNLCQPLYPFGFTFFACRVCNPHSSSNRSNICFQLEELTFSPISKNDHTRRTIHVLKIQQNANLNNLFYWSNRGLCCRLDSSWGSWGSWFFLRP